MHWYRFLVNSLCLITVYALTVFFSWHSIEDNLAANVNKKLEELDIHWAKAAANYRGRNILLEGNAPNRNAIEQAKEITLQVEGVRNVAFYGEQAKDLSLREPGLTLQFEAKTLKISGIVASQQDIAIITRHAATVFPGKKIINKLAIDAMTKDIADLTAFFHAIAPLDEGDEVAILGYKMLLRGDITTTEAKDAIDKKLTTAYPGSIVINQLHIGTSRIKNLNQHSEYRKKK